jgi:hypothetical protein
MTDTHRRIRKELLSGIGKAVERIAEEDPILAKVIQRMLWDTVSRVYDMSTVALSSEDQVKQRIEEALYFDHNTRR